ncbi:helix-turn-helix transcriptional regulator [Paenibacillus hodogayensis]|uniref:helix-turn-helix transcriptional regulator n=1 Tax=Paenibacillus hodogayensis TaxID=279208 RepID=UPI00406BB570
MRKPAKNSYRYENLAWRTCRQIYACKTPAGSQKSIRSHFEYTNSEGAGELRTVEPIGLAWKGYAWYLYTYCRLRNDYRTFAYQETCCIG